MRSDVITGLSRTLFVLAWAQYEEDHGRTHGGRNLFEVAPGSNAALRVAKRTVERLEDLNGAPLDDIVKNALAADQREYDSSYGEEFGRMLAYMVLGHGLSWFDDHATFPMLHPSMEVWADKYGPHWAVYAMGCGVAVVSRAGKAWHDQCASFVARTIDGRESMGSIESYRPTWPRGKHCEHCHGGSRIPPRRVRVELWNAR